MIPSSCIYRPPADAEACLVTHPVTGSRGLPAVTVLRRKNEVGAQCDDDDFRIPRGKPGNARKGGVRLNAVMDLLTAIRSEHLFTAYALPYIVTQGWKVWGPSPSRVGSPRVNKGPPSGFDWLAKQGFEATWGYLAIDMDNPYQEGSTTIKRRNIQESIAQWEEQLGRLQGWGWLISENGVHLMRPLKTAVVDGHLYERIGATARDEVNSLSWEAFGQQVKADDSCKDMGRLMSLAYIIKKGSWFYSPIVDLSRMTAHDYPPAAEKEYGGRARKAPKAAQSTPYSFVDEIPEYVDRMISHVSPATLNDKAPGFARHDLMLAVAMALISRGFEPELVPIATRSISLRLGLPHQHVADDFRGGKETVEKWQRGEPALTGMATLLRHAPSLARAIDVMASTARVRQASNGASPLLTADEATARNAALMRAEFSRMHDAPLPVITGTCGLGKSHTSLDLVVQNLSGAFPGWVKGKAVEYTKRALIVTPTQEVSAELQAALLTRGVHAARWTSGLSERDADGSFTCKKHDSIVYLAKGYLSAQHHVCNGGGKGGTPCPERDLGCRAAFGCVAPDGSPIDPSQPGFADRWPVQVASHARARHASASLGQHHKFIWDEMMELCKSETVEDADLAATLTVLQRSVEGEAGGYFEPRYAEAMLPAVLALRKRLADANAPIGVPDLNFADAMRTDDPALLDPTIEARSAPFPKSKDGRPTQQGVPWVKPPSVALARESPTVAQKISQAARVCGLLWRGLQPEAQTTATIVVDQDQIRQLLILEPSEAVALLREHKAPRVLLDADGVLREAELAPFFATAPIVHPCYVADAAPVERRVTAHPAARKGKATVKGKFVKGGRHLELLRVASDWAAERPDLQKLVIVTWKPLATIIRYARATDDSTRLSLATEWLALSQRERIDLLAAEVAEIPFPPASAVLHFGNVRGVDAYRDFDALVTIGDPIPNIHAMEAESAFIARVGGLSPEDAMALRDDLPQKRARADLGQAHGRLRHPRRSSPAHVLHIGHVADVLPAEWEHHTLDFREGDSLLARVEAGEAGGSKGGRPKAKVIDLAAERAKGLTVAQIAEKMGVNERTLRRQARGGQNPPLLRDQIKNRANNEPDQCTTGVGFVRAEVPRIVDEAAERASIQSESAANDASPPIPSANDNAAKQAG